MNRPLPLLLATLLAACAQPPTGEVATIARAVPPSVAALPTTAPTSTPTPRPRLPEPAAYFMSQLNADAPKPNNNCGPASLAMALAAFGKGPGGAAQGQILAARRLMTGAEDQQQLTDTDLIVKGARAAGLQADFITPGDFDASLADGKLVVVPGNPIAYDKRFTGAQYNGAIDTGHLMLLVGKTATGYLINDPLAKVDALEITPKELADFNAYQGWQGGVALSLAP